MHRIKKNVEIKAPVGRVYEMLTTPQNLPGIWPSMIEVSNVERKNDGSQKFDWVYKMAGLHFKGHAETVRAEPNKYVEIRNDSGIPSTFRWTYEARGGGTMVTCEVEYDMPTPVIGRLAEAVVAKLNEREMANVLENAKTALELSPQATANGPGATAHR